MKYFGGFIQWFRKKPVFHMMNILITKREQMESTKQIYFICFCIKLKKLLLIFLHISVNRIVNELETYMGIIAGETGIQLFLTFLLMIINSKFPFVLQKFRLKSKFSNNYKNNFSLIKKMSYKLKIKLKTKTEKISQYADLTMRIIEV